MLVGALSPVNHIGLHQVSESVTRTLSDKALPWFWSAKIFSLECDLEKEGWCLMGVMFQQQVSLSYCSAMMSESQGRKYLKAQCTHSYHGLWHMLTQPKSTTVHFLSGGYSCGVRLFGGADFLEWCHARTAKQLVAFSQESRCDNGHCLFWATDFLECCLALTPRHLPFSQASRNDEWHCLFWATDFL